MSSRFEHSMERAIREIVREEVAKALKLERARANARPCKCLPSSSLVVRRGEIVRENGGAA